MTPAGVGGAADRSDENEQALLELLRSATPFIDVRSPGEFARGAIPNATNLPLLTDSERHEVGLRYRAQGQAAAIALGESLVSGAVRAQRLEGWQAFAASHPQCWLYCWRGGLRSETAQRWLTEQGVRVPRVAGGFKALRALCLRQLDSAVNEKHWLVVGGRTGAGKTRLLQQIDQAIDLEALANHRGSAFGGYPTPQPTPVDFENAIAAACTRHEHALLVVEDESRTIGRLALPGNWHETMQAAPLIILEADLDYRIEHTRREYVDLPLAGGVTEEALRDQFVNALGRISKRLGGARHQTLVAILNQCFDAGGGHEAWIELLLTGYYDPMYDYQLKQKSERVMARGNMDELLSFIEGQLPKADEPTVL